ncbi:sulfite exporter TauE/SafE family protein [Petroclostridium sp. X23]|uniref:urease accessory protein UreH domain-containing protein n=1 Tax=Petroclostridium sp. X23 TaxID=3045146 RepID=UPI0024ADC865|nr:sulfite exporter TauE/SafE family protein [Petroclostridium sp. X23]WHH61539.1 sulfite exporter TauE/SafE family protein [Petroclostridium sp. X23]
MPQRVIQKTFMIDGMTCTSCEMRIENSLKKIDGVIYVKAAFSSSRVDISYDADKVDLANIISVIEKLHYKVKENGVSAVGRNGNAGNPADDRMKISHLLGIGILLLAAYTIINNTVGFNFIPEIDQSMGYGILFVVGILTSLHCIAMCGGINLSQCVAYHTGNEKGNLTKLKPSLLYNSGRVVSYTLIGGIVGALGSVVSFSGTAKGIVAVASGGFMVIMGLNMLNIFPWLRKLNPRMPKFFGNKIYNNKGNYGPFYVGLLNGLMPCGPLQAMQLYALGTGSFAAGALSMLMFSVGTVPLMFGFGAISSFLSGKFTNKMLKVSAVLVMILGVIMLNRGLSLSGISVAFAAPKLANVAVVEGDVQLVTTTLQSRRYSPIIVQKGIPVKWTIQADANSINGCNSPVTIPKYGLQKTLVPGDNIIEFTPDEEGNIPYTCWMGMITSNIKVVDDISKVSDADIQQAKESGGAGLFGGGGCCSAGSSAEKFANGNIPTDEIAIGEINDGVQNVSIAINDEGFIPAVVILQKGVKTKWNINGEQLNYCNNRLIFPEYNANISLKDGENAIEFTPEADFTFSCWMRMLNGYVKVVDDVNNINIEEIKKEIEQFQPVGGTGGCCG